MFQDLRYRGFEASPLQGTAQGLAVYQNGVRVNEAFGDTVNWEVIPQTAIARLDLWSNNPVFGLNALGGAINVIMKKRFSPGRAKRPHWKAALTGMAWRRCNMALTKAISVSMRASKA